MTPIAVQVLEIMWHAHTYVGWDRGAYVAGPTAFQIGWICNPERLEELLQLHTSHRCRLAMVCLSLSELSRRKRDQAFREDPQWEKEFSRRKARQHLVQEEWKWYWY